MNGESHARALAASSLPIIAAGANVPTYDRERLRQAVIHLGVGGFHRAHQAVYLDDLAQQGITNAWGEYGAGLLRSDRHIADALLPQQCLYTVVERGADVDQARVIGSMLDYLYAPADPERVLSALARPATRLVTLTITEGGYNIDEASGAFDTANPAIMHDLEHPAAPTTAFGYLTGALVRRRGAGLGPFTILSCDNLQGNGAITRNALLAFARLQDDALANWIAANVAFPNSMVDRITPQTTDADRALIAQEYGIIDAWPVVTEPFRQWIIEDRFSNGRPPLEEVGAQFVTDVRPYETMKLRLLNASHSAIGYLGALIGYRSIHDVMRNPLFRQFMAEMMDDEVTSLLPPAPGIDLTTYRHTLLERFANPKIGDQVARICLNGSAKVPKFLLPSVTEALVEGRPHRLLTLALAGWFRYLQGINEQGETITIEDPRASELHARALEGGENPRPLLGMRGIFGDLEQNAALVTELGAALHDLSQHGVQATLSRYLANPGRDIAIRLAHQ